MAVRRNSSKRPHRVEGDGTPLADETLLSIFATLPAIADLVRCAATCRRWRRLVSGEAAFLCQHTTRDLGNAGRFPTPLALGFVHNPNDDDEDPAGPPRFVATASAWRRFELRQQATPLSSLLADDAGLLPDDQSSSSSTSRVVASRNGLVVVDSRTGNKKRADRALRLCVCNLLTGHVHALPPLKGKDGVDQYACTVITAQDHDIRSTTSFFRVVMVYRRQGFTAFRSYSSDSDGAWSEEAKVTGARLVGREKMGLIGNGVVARGGGAVYWLAWDVVFGLRLDTLEAATVELTWPGVETGNVLLGLTPHGSLCAVRLDVVRRINTEMDRWHYTLRIRSFDNGRDGNDNDDVDDIKLQMNRLQKQTRKTIWTGEFFLDSIVELEMRWFCERSGVVFFSSAEWSYSNNRRYHMYAFSLDSKTVEKVASHVGNGDPWRNVHGYEMVDHAAYLAALAETPDTKDTRRHNDVDHPLSGSCRAGRR